MSEWIDDPKVMSSLDDLLTIQEPFLQVFLESIFPYSEQTPIWGILMLYGKFVQRYTELRVEEIEPDAYNIAVADLANDPLVGQLVASVMGKTLDRGLNIE